MAKLFHAIMRIKYSNYSYRNGTVRDSNKDRNGNSIQSNELNNSYIERSYSANALKEIMVGFAKPPSRARPY